MLLRPLSFVLRPLSFVIRNSYFVICNSYFVIRNSYFVIRNSYFVICTSCLVLLTSTILQAASDPSNLLWYRQPAATWNEALPIGNGRLGGMIFGGAPAERIALNEDSVWAGEKRDRNNPQGAKNIAEVRRLLVAGKPQEAEKLADQTIISTPRRLPPYQPLGDLLVRFPGHEDRNDYRRQLDLDTGIVRVTYRSGGHLFTREVFCSAVGQVLVVRLTSDSKGAISLSATLARERDATARALGNHVVLEGEAIPHGERQKDERKVGVRFHAVLEAVAEGGTIRTEGSDLVVERADAVTLLLAAATNYREKDLAARCDRTLQAARQPYAQLRSSHVTDHQRLFRRVRLDLAASVSDVPTDQRLERLRAGASDPQLVSLYFQFGRYLLIGSSRPGSLAATLQGIWNDLLAPPWDSKYTININTEMNYWLAELGNLSELHEPLFDLIDLARQDGRRIARELYGSSGFVLHHNTDAWGHAVPIDGVGSGIWPMGGAWLSLHFWDRYDFTRDRAFLSKRAYPALKEAAEFLLDYLVDDGKGNLITGPSISPENRYRTSDGAVAKLCMGPYMDTQIAHALFGRVIEAGQLLGRDADLRRRLSAARARLPAPKIGRHGQLQEWLEDYDEPDPGHRHISHLFALHPGNQITPRHTPELARAARVTLERRLKAGGGGTGWSRAWIVNFWARLEQGDLAHENVVALLGKSTLPNLMDTHPPFQIDGNFGGAAGIIEMLLQSHAGEISLLPALPAAWLQGSVTGLRARGAVEVDIRWASGKATGVVLRPAVGGQFKLRAPRGQKIVALNNKPVSLRQDGTVTVKLGAGKRYELSFE